MIENRQLKLYLAKNLPYLWVEVPWHPVERPIQPAPPQPLAVPLIELLILPFSCCWPQKTANGTLLLPQKSEQDRQLMRGLNEALHYV